MIAIRGALALGASLLYILSTTSLENLGPQDMVQTAAGDIHRHDFVRRFGWPVVCAEQYVVHWYVYRSSGVVGATPQQRELWNRERIAELEAIPEQHFLYGELRADLDRYRAIADGNFWRFHWRAVLTVIVTWVVLIELGMLGGKRIREAWMVRRHREGLCSVCGYDLRATPDRCPECGHVAILPASPREHQHRK